MDKVLSILLLFLASSAQASIQSFKTDETAIRPVRIIEEKKVGDPALQRPCGRPILLLMKLPGGRVILVGVFLPKQSC
ncbi:MAG: hypothetical protein JWM58_2727 [Rhizobium sp.]|nr:hypothetical protein [Rhizobium sp.]